MTKRKTRRQRGLAIAARLRQSYALEADNLSLKREIKNLGYQLQYQREGMVVEILSRIANEYNSPEAFLEHAMRKLYGDLGHAFGEQLGNQLKAYNPIFDHARKIADNMLNIAYKSIDLRAFAVERDRAEYDIRISTPPLNKNYRIMI